MGGVKLASCEAFLVVGLLYFVIVVSVILGNNNNKLLENSVLHTRNKGPLNQHITVCKGIYDPQQVYKTLTQQRQENKGQEEK